MDIVEEAKEIVIKNSGLSRVVIEIDFKFFKQLVEKVEMLQGQFEITQRVAGGGGCGHPETELRGNIKCCLICHEEWKIIEFGKPPIEGGGGGC